MSARDRWETWSIALASVVVLGFLFWLLYGRTPGAVAPVWTSRLPAVNAVLNGTCTLFLLAGFAAIRRGHRERHHRLMLAALSSSVLFLVSYVVYHHFHGDTPFQGQGPIRIVYFVVLITHIVGSVIVLPLVLTTLRFAATSRFERHRRWARVTLPVWLYVSVTGVAVYLFLR